jgi:hypothetical protein
MLALHQSMGIFICLRSGDASLSFLFFHLCSLRHACKPNLQLSLSEKDTHKPQLASGGGSQTSLSPDTIDANTLNLKKSLRELAGPSQEAAAESASELFLPYGPAEKP